MTPRGRPRRRATSRRVDASVARRRSSSTGREWTDRLVSGSCGSARRPPLSSEVRARHAFEADPPDRRDDRVQRVRKRGRSRVREEGHAPASGRRAVVRTIVQDLTEGAVTLDGIEGIHHPRTKRTESGQANTATIYARVSGELPSRFPGQPAVQLDEDILTFLCEQLEDRRWICSTVSCKRWSIWGRRCSTISSSRGSSGRRGAAPRDILSWPGPGPARCGLRDRPAEDSARLRSEASASRG